ncbi:MAG TPA: hypothetical protein VJ867_16200 [Gemmatimonadaceae bacterium]|nr:hypothetical protein [Gemmatimonadaceae bacterium]
MADDSSPLPPLTLDERLSINTWAGGPTPKERGAVQRAVTELLDALAPEQLLTRRERAGQRIEQYRTPNGCILQGPTAALSVTWFAESPSEASFGELHLLLWKGVVSRRGAPPARGGAQLLSEQVLRPVIVEEGRCVWEDAASARSDTAAVAARCIALLEEQLAA